MNRPYIVCHMLTALDGKITGPFMDSPAVSAKNMSAQTKRIILRHGYAGA